MHILAKNSGAESCESDLEGVYEEIGFEIWRNLHGDGNTFISKWEWDNLIKWVFYIPQYIMEIPVLNIFQRYIPNP